MNKYCLNQISGYLANVIFAILILINMHRGIIHKKKIAKLLQFDMIQKIKIKMLSKRRIEPTPTYVEACIK